MSTIRTNLNLQEQTMETTQNRLPAFAEHFFNRLRNFLHTPLYFYGSVQRPDFFPGHSDYDVDLFTDNERATIQQICSFLDKEKCEFRKFVYRLHRSNRVVRGYKVKHKDPENHFKAEIAIYNKRDQEDVLQEHRFKTILPWHVMCLLYVLKYVYYHLAILPKPWYTCCKRYLMNHLVEGEDAEFVITDLD